MSNYATKADLKNATSVDTSDFAKKNYLVNLKSDVDKLDIDTLKSIPSNLNVVSATFLLVFFKSKLEHWERCFLFHFKSSFRSQENQILEFYILKIHGVIKCLSIKEEIHFTE